MNFDDLDIRQKAEIIKVGVKNGFTSLNDIKEEYNLFAQGGSIHIKPENKGKFTAAAKSRRMGVQEFASKVLANKENYSSTMVKRANFARNASHWKHQDGGDLNINNNTEYSGFLIKQPNITVENPYMYNPSFKSYQENKDELLQESQNILHNNLLNPNQQQLNNAFQTISEIQNSHSGYTQDINYLKSYKLNQEKANKFKKDITKGLNTYYTGGPLYPFSFNGNIPEVRYLNGGKLFEQGGDKNSNVERLNERKLM